MNPLNATLLRAEPFLYTSKQLPNFQLVPRRCYNYELEFYTHCNGGVIVDGDYVEFQKGDLNFRHPNQVVCGIPPYEGYILCFSFANQPPSPYSGFGSTETQEAVSDHQLVQQLPTHIRPNNPQEILKLIRELVQAFSCEEELEQFNANLLLHQLLYNLFKNDSIKQIVLHPKVAQAEKLIQAEFTSPISIQQLIEESGLSKAYFHKCFKEQYHCTPTELMIKLRIQKAKLLLTQTEDKIADIAAACGYLDSVYFTSLFKRTVNQTPRDYRKLTKTAIQLSSDTLSHEKGLL